MDGSRRQSEYGSGDCRAGLVSKDAGPGAFFRLRIPSQGEQNKSQRGLACAAHTKA